MSTPCVLRTVDPISAARGDAAGDLDDERALARVDADPAQLLVAIEEARRRGCGLVQLTSSVSRTDAHRFDDRLGFTASHVGYELDLEQTPTPER